MYNFRRAIHITRQVFSKNEGTPAHLTLKRFMVLLIFYAIYLSVEVINWTCLTLDELFYPRLHQVKVKRPVFIIGNPRSGSTFLHRLMAEDAQNFSSMNLWEILFAPSVIQRKFARFVRKIDAVFGGGLLKLFHRIDAKLRVSNVMHRIGLLVPEEDEYLMIHLASTIIAGLFFGLVGESYPFLYFDFEISEREKTNVMRFYHSMIRRHLHASDPSRMYLSKNPYASSKVERLYREFPDACVIYLVRNPLNVIPSYASLCAHWWHLLGQPSERYPQPEYILHATQYWYRHPLQKLSEMPEQRYLIVNFDEMIADPERTVREIYAHFGIELSPEYADILKREAEAARGYRSEHSYSLDAIGYSKDQIIALYADIFERWGFPTTI